MSTAIKPNSDRVRQIAILVSSVDATAARQLLLHLPTGLAKQVRALASQLGPISPAEKRSILAAFQQSNVNSSPPKPVSPAATKAGNPVAADAVFSSDEQLGALPTAAMAAQAKGDEPIDGQSETAPAWTKLSTEALVRFVQGERVAVIAVVISQLAPKKAVEVLQHLPRDMHHAVIKRLSHLQDIDPDATAAIDEHLVERLSQYEYRVESEHENTRRLNALLSAAPLDLRDEWRNLLSGDGVWSAVETLRTKATIAVEKSTSATIAELYGDAVIMTDSMVSTRPVTQATQATFANDFSAGSAFASGTSATESTATTSTTQDLVADEFEELADVLPFPTPASEKQAAVDRILLHAEFERILTLSVQDLAVLLSNIDSQTVLLAFAGSSPEFMQRFTRMLKPSDAKMFVKRLQKIGPMNLREVDEAQRRIVESAARMMEAYESRMHRAA
jgi:flagellar motor switch protein FliG